MSRADLAMAAKRAARLAAVQALYQLEVGGGAPARVIEDLQAGRLPLGEAGPMDVDPDLTLFSLIVTTAVDKQIGVDRTIARRLAKAWRLDRIDSVARAVLRAGVVELWARRETPAAVIVDEYVEVANAFFDGPEPGFVNATLEACARDLRGQDAFTGRELDDEPAASGQ